MRASALILVLAACGSDGGKPMSTKTFGGDRPADLETPATLTDGKQYPLVVVLHGFTSNGFLQGAYFHMNKLTDLDAALWIAPDGIANSAGEQFWNADPACCDRENQNPDDVGYLGKLVEDIEAEWPIDETQVFLLGHSNGGYMAYRMACERADLIAAIGSLAGDAATTPSTCNPSQPVSVLHMHGTNDGTVPYSGAVPSVEQWAEHDGCGTTRSATVTLDLDTAIDGSETHGETTAGCPAGVAVDLWTLDGSTHIPGLNDMIPGVIFDWFTAHKR